MSSTDDDEIMTARGNCYHSCFQGDLPEITIHSIMGFGSRHVEKMKIVKTTGVEVEYFNNNTRERRPLRKQFRENSLWAIFFKAINSNITVELKY